MLPLGAIVVLLLLASLVRINPRLKKLANEAVQEDEDKVRHLRRQLVRKLHHIDTTDVVNVGVAVDIIARIGHSAAFAAVVTGVVYIVIAALFTAAE